jgi:conjugal transfer pilin signal peptidase TrbI
MQLKKILFVISMLCILMAGCFIWQSKTSSCLAIVDMQRLLNQPAVLLAQSKLSETAQKKLLKRYTALLPQVLTEYGKVHQLTLITATVITGGTLDVTDEVIEETLERLKAS